jgi:hypothetical protein
MYYVALFFAGMFLCNAIPHVAAGVRGEVFPSPFSKPHGKGPSSPLVNFLWGSLNVIVGTLLLAGHPVALGLNAGSAALAAGALIIGIFLSVHFGQVRREGLF